MGVEDDSDEDDDDHADERLQDLASSTSPVIKQDEVNSSASSLPSEETEKERTEGTVRTKQTEQEHVTKAENSSQEQMENIPDDLTEETQQSSISQVSRNECNWVWYLYGRLWKNIPDSDLWFNIHFAQKIPRRFLKPAMCKYPTTVNNSEIYILLPKPCPWMWYLMCGNRVRFGSNGKPEIGKTRSLKLALLKIAIGAALYTTTQTCTYSLNQHKALWLDGRFLLHLNTVLIIRVIIDSTVLSVVQHTAHRNFQKCNFWWTHLACFGPSIVDISHTISAHKVSH